MHSRYWLLEYYFRKKNYLLWGLLVIVYEDFSYSYPARLNKKSKIELWFIFMEGNSFWIISTKQDTCFWFTFFLLLIWFWLAVDLFFEELLSIELYQLSEWLIDNFKFVWYQFSVQTQNCEFCCSIDFQQYIYWLLLIRSCIFDEYSVDSSGITI